MNTALTRLAPLVLIALSFAILLACDSGGGGGGGGSPVSAAFAPSVTPAAANLVRLEGRATDSNTVVLDIVIDGPTTSSDLYSFAFDIELSNTSVARYVSGSAEFGNALTLGAGQGSSVLASQSGNRVVVGVSKTGGGAGNGVPAGERTIVTLVFDVIGTGTTNLLFRGSSDPGNPTGAPAALDSQGGVVASVFFDGDAARISG